MDPHQRFTENIKLVPFAVHQVLHRPVGAVQDDEDLVQVGSIGLWNACLTYDESKGYKFSSYATKCIINEVCLYLRRNVMNQIKTVSIENIVSKGNEDDSTLTYENSLEDQHTDLIKRMQINEIVKTLTPKEKEIFQALYAGNTQSKIAQNLHVTRQHINNIYNNIKNKFKEVLE